MKNASNATSAFGSPNPLAIRHFSRLGALALALAPLLAQDTNPSGTPAGDTWSKAIAQRSERGTLEVHRETIRGDTGKWSDEPRLQHVPPMGGKTGVQSLDDWADQAAGKKFQPTANDGNWLVVRTRQLDDNDRVWVEKVERRGKAFTIVLNEAVWKGYYNKTFTYYQALAVSLGKLPPGTYEAKCIIQPLSFKQLEKPAQPNIDNKRNWPTDEQPASSKAAELSVQFTVTPAR